MDHYPEPDYFLFIFMLEPDNFFLKFWEPEIYFFENRDNPLPPESYGPCLRNVVSRLLLKYVPPHLKEGSSFNDKWYHILQNASIHYMVSKRVQFHSDDVGLHGLSITILDVQVIV